MDRLPTLFISHGSPETAIADTPAAGFLKAFGASLPRPRAIVLASAHFEVEGFVATSHDARPETIHDFGGFPPALYAIRYAAPGDPALAEEIAGDLARQGFVAHAIDRRGFDHGTWVPLSLIYPAADIPVVQVSVDPAAGPAHHLKLGQALSKLRDHGILVIGSGSFTHNLPEAFKALRVGERDAVMPEWVSAFIAWMDARIVAGDEAGLLAYRAAAPYAAENHPTDEHLLPLYVAIGAAGRGWRGEKIHESHEYGVLSMDAFAFH